MSDSMSKEEKEYMRYVRSVMNSEPADDSLTKLCSSIECFFDADNLMVMHEYDYKRGTIDFIMVDIRDNNNNLKLTTTFYVEEIIDVDIFTGDTWGGALHTVTSAFIREIDTMYGLIVIPSQQPPKDEFTF